MIHPQDRDVTLPEALGQRVGETGTVTKSESV